MRSPRRRYATGETCPPAAPRPPKSRKLFWGALGATVAVGAGVVYAKNTPEVRNWLESNVPWADDLVAVVYQENTTYWKFAQKQMGNVSGALSSFLFGKEGVTPVVVKSRADQDINKDAESSYMPKDYSLPPQGLKEIYVEPKPPLPPAEVQHEATLVQTEGCDPPAAKPPASPASPGTAKELSLQESIMFANTKTAVDGFKKAVKLCSEYNTLITKFVEAPLEGIDKKQFDKLRAVQKERDDSEKAAREASAKAQAAMAAIETQLHSPSLGLAPEVIAQTKRHIKTFFEDLKRAEDDYQKEFQRSFIMDRFFDKVENARKMYQSELEILFPGIDLSAKTLDVKGHIDLFLIYTMKQVALLQNEIAELQTVRENDIKRALECQEEQALIEAKVRELVKKDKLQQELEFQKKALQIAKEHESKLKEELRRQYETQEAVMQKRLKVKEEEIMKKFNKTVSELVEKERIEYKKELAAMAGKLKAIEQTLKNRASAEAEAKQSQSIWTAAEALLAATRRPLNTIKIEKEIDALEKAGKEDKLVRTVVGGISREAREEGIPTEKALKDRFDALENTARSVALVGKDGASLPVYFLSWLQSKLLFHNLGAIPKDELNDQPIEFSKLDTFDIIQRARYHMDRGNIESALRYMNLLCGAPRAAAAGWARAARRHLEVRQAAETVMAHASLAAMVHD